MRRAITGTGLALFFVLALVASAAASTGEFERTWGKDVSIGGSTGAEICTTAASCTAGVSGGLGGEFKTPQGIATDAAGNVYVSDYLNHRIQVFDSSGNFERAWGKDVINNGAPAGFEICTVAASCKEGVSGGLGGELSLPAGIAVDASGNVYVNDYGNQRIQKFDSSGNFQRAWGKDVVTGGGTGAEICTVAANCKAGAFGNLAGEFNSPTGVAASPAGDVYVSDQDNRIQKFDSAGNFQRSWGRDVINNGAPTGFEICTVAANCQGGLTGGLGGELSNPIGMAVDAQGDVYVADFNNQRIQKYDSSGNFQRAWGKDVDVASGTGFEVCSVAISCKAGVAGGGLGGEFNGPLDPAADAAGNIYVSDATNNRIQVFDASGGFRQAWGKDVDATAAGTGYEICAVAANCKAGATGGLGGELNQPFGTAADPAGNVYVVDYLNQRVQKFLQPIPPQPPTEPPVQPPATPPDNSFVIGKVKGKKLSVTVPGPGQIGVTDAGASKRKVLLKPSSVTASVAGTVNVKLRLTKPAKKQLKRKHKVRVSAAITFTPAGGSANSQDKTLKVKKKQK